MTDDPDATPPLIAAGGYCLPSETMYDVILSDPGPELPTMTVRRGRLNYVDERSTAQIRADEALHGRLSRHRVRLVERQQAVIDAACREALAGGWDLHLYRRPATHFGGRLRSIRDLDHLAHIGVEFQPARYAIPTVVEHDDHDVSWTDDDDW